MNYTVQSASGSLLHLLRYKIIAYKNGLFDRKHRSRTIVLTFIYLLFSVSLWTYGYGIAKIDLHLSHPGTDMVTPILSALFTGWMFFMLYSCFTASVFILFHSSDMDFLITSPCSLRTVFIFKFIETLVVVAGIGFLIILPILLAFGVHSHAALYYYPVMLVFLCFFMTIPTSLGTILCLPVVRIFSRSGLREILKAIGGIFWIAMWFGLQYLMRNPGQYRSSTLETTLEKTRFISVFLPSGWLATFLRNTALGQPMESLDSLILLLTTGATFFLLSLILAGKYYLNSLTASSEVQAGVKMTASSKILSRTFTFMPRLFRGFIMKDWLTFKRDLKQFSGILILAVLLIVGPVVLSAGRKGDTLFPFLFVSFLLVTAALQIGIRQFPMESLNFWLVLTSPKKRSQIIFSKFVFAAAITTVLIFLSLTGMLLSGPGRSVSILCLISIAPLVSICPTAVGIYLGVRHSRFDWTNPKRTLKTSGIIIYFISIFFLGICTYLILYLPHFFIKFLPDFASWLEYLVLIASFIINSGLAVFFLFLSMGFLKRMEWDY